MHALLTGLNKIVRPVTAVVTMTALLGLIACEDSRTNKAINERSDEAVRAIQAMANQSPTKSYNPLVVTDRVWNGSSAIRMQRGVPLPPRYETDRGVTLVSSDPMSLSEIAIAITTQTGIPVRLNDAAPATGSAPRPTPTPGVGGSSSANNSGMPMAYEGSLSGLMERVGGFFGVQWRYDGSTISVSRFETRVFVVEALPGTQTVQDSIDSTGSGSSGGGSSGGGSGGGSSGGGSSSGSNGGGSGSGASTTSSMSQSAQFSGEIKYWDELSGVLTAMLGGTGSVVISPSIGTVTVTTTPEVMRTVATYMAQENRRLSRQIAINVEIYVVSLTEGLTFSSAFTTALRHVAGLKFNQTVSGGLPASVVSGVIANSPAQFNVSILNSDRVGQLNDVFTALSGIGDTTTVARFPLVTLNNRPVSRFVGEQRQYVSKVSGNSAVGTTTSTSTNIETDSLNVGFTIQMTPRLLDDGRILLQYSLSSVEQIGNFAKFNSVCGDDTTCTPPQGSGTVQTANTANRNFVQQSVLKSGSMLLIGGAEREDLQQSSQGVGSPFNYLLGGGLSTAKRHSMIFIAVSPQVIEEPRSEHE